MVNSDKPEVLDDITLINEPKDTPTETKQTEKVETFTREQVDSQIKQARNAVLADLGRYKAEAEQHRKAAESALQRVERLRKEQEQAELEAAKDDPERLNLVTERQKRRELESKLESAESELTLREERLKALEAKEAESSRMQKAVELATQYKVDPKVLLNVTDGSADKMEELAKIISPKSDKKPLKTDSGRMIGGTANWDEVRAAFSKNPYDPAIRSQYLEMRSKYRP